MTTEHQLQVGVVEALGLALKPDCRLVASLNGAHLVGGGRQWWKLQRAGAAAGFPDLQLFANGKTLFFELKKPGSRAKPEPEQVDWADYLTRQGHDVFLVSSIEEVEAVCARLGLLARKVTITKA